MNKMTVGPVMREQMQEEIGKLIDICHANLNNSSECLRYLKDERGLSDQSIKKYRIGFFPQNIQKLTRFVSAATLEKINILNYSGNSKFSEFFYLIFPIISEYKEPIGIGGRTLLNDDQRKIAELPKYENSSFKKAHFLYGLDHSRGHILKSKNVFVSEGYFDQIAMDSNGIKNSVAICGTAFSRLHFLKLARYTDKITFVLDRDDGGKRSMESIQSKFANRGIRLRFMLLPESCKDIDQYFASGGTKETFNRDIKSFIPNW
jgi:DNA primase